MSDLKQPKARGTAHVDYTAHSERVKIVVWVEGRDCDIADGDDVQILTLSRLMRYAWAPSYE